MKSILLFLILTSTITVFSQKKKEEQQINIVRHTVALGETVKMISKKYRLPPSEIYNLNKKAVNGVSGGTILFIPVPVKDISVATIENDLEGSAKENSNTAVVAKNIEKKTSNPENVAELEYKIEFFYHTVLSGETLFAIAKKYNTSVEEINSINEVVLKKGLQVGQKLKIKKQLVF